MGPGSGLSAHSVEEAILSFAMATAIRDVMVTARSSISTLP